MSDEARNEAVVEGLPSGWRRQELVRPKGLRVTSGHTEVYYVSPDGVRCANKREMWSLLPAKERERIDLTLFDWQTGKMLQQTVNAAKAKRPRIGSTAAPTPRDRPTPFDHAKLSSSYQMPVRQSLPFTLNSRQSVTLVRNHTDSERKEKESKSAVLDDCPRQLFWEKRLTPAVTYVDSEGDVEQSNVTSSTLSNARKSGWPARLVPNAPATTNADEQQLLVLRSVTELLNEAATRARTGAVGTPLIGQQLRFGGTTASTNEPHSGGWTCASQQNVAHQQAVAAALRDVQQPLVTRISAGELNSMLRAEVRRGESRVRKLRRCLQAALDAFGDDCGSEKRAEEPQIDAKKADTPAEQPQVAS